MATHTTGTDLLRALDHGDDGAIGELNVYILALDSYPDHFADEPRLSFQQHLQNVIIAENRRLAGHLQA
jgi:hypothetical protein